MANICRTSKSESQSVIVKSENSFARFRVFPDPSVTTHKFPEWTSAFFAKEQLEAAESFTQANEDKPLQYILEGPVNHSGDYESCWRLFAHPNLFDHLETVAKFVSIDEQSVGQLFAFPLMGKEYIFRVKSLEPSDGDLGISGVSIPRPVLFNKTENHPLPSFKSNQVCLFHGVSVDWTPPCGSAWHALDLHIQAPCRTSLLNIILNLKKAGISELIVWGIDAVPSEHLSLLTETVTSIKSPDFKLVFVAASLSLTSPALLESIKPENIFAIERKASGGIIKSSKRVEVPDISRIPESAIATAETYLVLPLTRPDLVAPFAKVIPNMASPKVLICGGPQSGKSSLAKWMVSKVQEYDSNIAVFESSASALFSKYLGSSEKRVMNLFKKATISAPSVIVIEGIHSLCPSRDAQEEDGETGVGETYNRMVATFLNCLDGVDTRDRRVAVIATSLLPPDKLDPAAVRPGRLETHIHL